MPNPFFIPVAPRPPRSPMPIAPLAPAQSALAPTVDAGFAKQKADLANRKFNEWYGGLHQDDVEAFTPKTDTFSGNGADLHQTGEVSQRTPDELSAARRAAAREHFNANILPGDPEHQALINKNANRGLVPLAPPPPGTTIRETKKDPLTGSTTVTTTAPPKVAIPPDPSVVALRKAQEDAANQLTQNRAAATQPGGKDYKDPNAPDYKGAALDQKTAAAAQKATADRAQFEAKMRGMTIQQPSGLRAPRFTDEDIRGMSDEMFGKRNGQATLDIPQAGIWTTPIPDQVSGLAPPAGRGTGVAAPVQPPAGRGPFPPGQIPHDPSHDIPGARGLKNGRPVVFENGKWQYADQG